MEKRLVPIGKIIRVHGIKGKVKVHYFGDDLGEFLRYREVIIEDRAGVPRTYDVLEATPQPPRLILTLKGIEKIEDAEPLVRRDVFIERGVLPDLEEGEYYWVDLLGMEVESDRRGKLGRLQEIFSTGANDVFVVKGKRGEIFLPATDEVIRKVDRERGVIEVHRMEGLWEEEDEV